MKWLRALIIAWGVGLVALGGFYVAGRLIFGAPGVIDLTVENRLDRPLLAGAYRRDGREWKQLPPTLAAIAPHSTTRATLKRVSNSDVEVRYSIAGLGGRIAYCGYPMDGINVEVTIVAERDSLKRTHSAGYELRGKTRIPIGSARESL